MTIRIGDNEYCLDGYMTEIQKLIFDAYHQGLVDGIGKGRADAIEEYKYTLLNLIHQIPQKCIGGANVKEVAEQLKEQN